MSLPIKDATSNGTGSGSTVTVAHTVTNSHSNLILIVAVSNNDTSDPTVTYAGASMTNLASIVSGSNRLVFFYKLNPATGTNNIVVSQGSTITAEVCGISYYNTAQSSTFGTPATNSGTGSPSSNTVTTTSTNQLVIDAFDAFLVTSATQPNGETVETTNTAVNYHAIGDIPATGSNMSLAWTFSAGAWAQISVAMNGVASSGGRFITSMDPFMSPGYIPGVTQ